ncbi:unnamed protein product [Dovyalis caffra]|uniref:Uncharacterized protein n=1 Tax=Dovyalis caffra TaxID=77055 RepID=A0AAV1RMZ4_9ROSI|nr:unnamed protein product [Dovyalis caffra]
MEKRVLLGVQNKNNPIKKNKKRFLKKVVDYMKSDSYMFAPLISNQPADFLASKSSSSSITAVEMKEGMKERNKRLLEKVGDYLKSDTYMYAPFCDQQVISLKVIASVASARWAHPIVYTNMIHIIEITRFYAGFQPTVILLLYPVLRQAILT